MSFADLKIVTCMLSRRQNYRPQMFSKNEVFCGPDCETVESANGYQSIKTPVGLYDIQHIIKRLPEQQQPDLVIVKADGTNRNFPVNLQSLNCKKLLILGDTHHLPTPIRVLLMYASQEKFDYICSDHDRQHLHFFKDANLAEVFWSPVLNLNPHPQRFCEKRQHEACFVGNMGRFHPYRNHIINALQKSGLPVKVCQASQEETAEIYNKSLISLNCSLNGDLNLRVLEIISSGGFLITDKLSPESGIDLLLEDGIHYRSYASSEELINLLKWYLDNPVEALEIARAGYDHYQKHHAPEIRVQELFEFIFNGRIDKQFSISSRTNQPIVISDDGLQRVALYEYFLDLQLNNPSLKLALSGKSMETIGIDLADLNRISVIPLGIDSDIVDMVLINEEELAPLSIPETFQEQPFLRLMVLNQSDRENERHLRRAGLKKIDHDHHVYD